MIYFITDGEYVKIGVTANLNTRLQVLQTGNPRKLSVVDTMKGSYYEEKALHHWFKELSGYGEWFKMSSKDVFKITCGSSTILNDAVAAYKALSTEKRTSPEESVKSMIEFFFEVEHCQLHCNASTLKPYMDQFNVTPFLFKNHNDGLFRGVNVDREFKTRKSLEKYIKFCEGFTDGMGLDKAASKFGVSKSTIIKFKKIKANE